MLSGVLFASIVSETMVDPGPRAFCVCLAFTFYILHSALCIVIVIVHVHCGCVTPRLPRGVPASL